MSARSDHVNALRNERASLPRGAEYARRAREIDAELARFSNQPAETVLEVPEAPGPMSRARAKKTVKE